MNFKDRAKKLRADIPAIFLSLKDKNTPIIARIFAAITIGYALSPIDLIPDFIPVLGYLDDVILLPVFVAITIKLIPKEVRERCRKQAEHLWDKGKPKRWYYALPILFMWALILWLFIKSIWL